MSDRKRLQIYVTEENYQQLKEWADETGKSISELGREAILEYTDHDRLRRIEDKLDLLVDTDSEANNTHTQRTNSVPKKARAVADHIFSTYDEVVKNEDVEFSIENIAGVGDSRSIKRYKNQFRKRGLLYEHPGDPPLWTTGTDQFTEWLASYAKLNGKDAAEEVADQYPEVMVSYGTNNSVQIEVDQ